jgi:hypothetical protein
MLIYRGPQTQQGPDVFGRSLERRGDGILYKDRGLEALVLKNHVATTADRAWFARKHVPKYLAASTISAARDLPPRDAAQVPQGRLAPFVARGEPPLEWPSTPSLTSARERMLCRATRVNDICAPNEV